MYSFFFLAIEFNNLFFFSILFILKASLDMITSSVMSVRLGNRTYVGKQEKVLSFLYLTPSASAENNVYL